MYAGLAGKQIGCTISGYCRTQIFEFPRINLQVDSIGSSHSIYKSSSVQSCVTSDLTAHFENSGENAHYAISAPLRHAVKETAEKTKVQQNGRPVAFLVIEESSQLNPKQMIKGECSQVDEVVREAGELVPMLTGGRQGEKFIIASPTIDGAWPELPNNGQIVNLILAAVRAGQETADPIHKRIEQDCLVTNDGQFVMISRSSMSARINTVVAMDDAALITRVKEIRNAISSMEQDFNLPHVALLFDAMYRDEYKGEADLKLQYLKLWQSLSEAGKKYLVYQGNVRDAAEVVAGKKTLKELKRYRNAIAHWWTDSIDENYLADLQRTINELIRRKYF